MQLTCYLIATVWSIAQKLTRPNVKRRIPLQSQNVWPVSVSDERFNKIKFSTLPSQIYYVGRISRVFVVHKDL